MPAGFLNHQNVVSQVMAPVSSTSLSNKNPSPNPSPTPRNCKLAKRLMAAWLSHGWFQHGYHRKIATAICSLKISHHMSWVQYVFPAGFNIFQLLMYHCFRSFSKIIRSFQDLLKKFEVAWHKTQEYRRSALKHNVYHNYHPIFGTWSASYRSIFFGKKWTCQPTNFRSQEWPNHTILPPSPSCCRLVYLDATVPLEPENDRRGHHPCPRQRLVRHWEWARRSRSTHPEENSDAGCTPVFRVQRWRLL